MNFIFCLMVGSVVALLLGGLSPAWSISEEELRNVEALRKELAEMQIEETSQISESKKIEVRKATLLATRKLIQGSQKNIEKDHAGLLSEVARQKIALQSFEAKIAPLEAKIDDHGRRCAGVLAPEAFDACSVEKAHLDRLSLPYVAEVKRISNWAFLIRDKKTTLDIRREMIEKQKKSLNKAVLTWAKRKKNNNADIRALSLKKESILQKIRSLLLNDSFLDDLKEREQIARACANLNDAMAATRCLDRIYDGSR